MVVNDRVLRNLSLAYKSRYFLVPYAQSVGKWCLEYLAKYDRAPGADIQTIYEAHRRNGLDSETAELIGQFLGSISEQYENSDGINSEYLLDQAANYFQERALTLLKEDLEERLGQGNILAAKEAVANFIAPEKVVTLGYEPLRDMNLVRDAFESEDELFSLPGDLGKMLGPFVREDAWGLVGAYKAGKSWTCTYIQDQAIYQRLNVARFSFEMNKKKETRRFIQSICAMPDKPPRDGNIWLPVWDCRLNQEGTCSRQERVNNVALYDNEKNRPAFGHAPAGYAPCAVCKGKKGWHLESWVEPYKCDVLTWRTAWRRAEAISQQLRGARFKFQYWPIRSAGIQEVKATLQVWEHLEGFIPDVIVVDSPDIMRFPGKEPRHAIVDNRREVVALAQQYHALVIFPLQAGSKTAIERKDKKQSDIGESVAILGDVDAMMVIDSTEAEYQAMRARIKTTVQRDERRGSQVAILQALDLGQAIIDSAFIQGKK